MGIRSITRLIKAKSPTSIQTTALYTLKDKTVAIDASIFLYKSLANIRNNGEYLKNSEGQVISHIIGILNKTLQYIDLGIIPIYIFDGKPPVEKQSVLDERNKKATESKLLSEKSLTPEDKQKHEKNSIRVKKYHVNDITKLLDLMGVSYIFSPGEAEVYASELCRIGYVDYVITEDMDCLPSGCPNMIRSCLDKSIKRNDVVSIINLEQILKDFEMNIDEFIDMCILCGCDYCPTIPNIGTFRAFQHIQKHKSIEKFIQSYTSNNIPEGFINKYDKARGLFKINHSLIKEDEIVIHTSKYNEKFRDYLLNTCNYQEKKITKICNKLTQK